MSLKGIFTKDMEVTWKDFAIFFIILALGGLFLYAGLPMLHELVTPPQESVVFRTNAIDGNYVDRTWIAVDLDLDGGMNAYGYAARRGFSTLSCEEMVADPGMQTVLTIPGDYALYKQQDWLLWFDPEPTDSRCSQLLYGTGEINKYFSAPFDISEASLAELSSSPTEPYTSNGQEICHYTSQYYNCRDRPIDVLCEMTGGAWSKSGCKCQSGGTFHPELGCILPCEIDKDCEAYTKLRLDCTGEWSCVNNVCEFTCTAYCGDGACAYSELLTCPTDCSNATTMYCDVLSKPEDCLALSWDPVCGINNELYPNPCTACVYVSSFTMGECPTIQCWKLVNNECVRFVTEDECSLSSILSFSPSFEAPSIYSTIESCQAAIEPACMVDSDCSDYNKSTDEACINNTCIYTIIPACPDGEVTFKCMCGEHVVTSRYCCDGLLSSVSCMTCRASCTAWSECVNFVQTRTCTTADCETYTETQACGLIVPEPSPTECTVDADCPPIEIVVNCYGGTELVHASTCDAGACRMPVFAPLDCSAWYWRILIPLRDFWARLTEGLYYG